MKSDVQEQNTNNISERRKDSGKVANEEPIGSQLFRTVPSPSPYANLSPYAVPLPFFYPRLDSQPQRKTTILSQDR